MNDQVTIPVDGSWARSPSARYGAPLGAGSLRCSEPDRADSAERPTLSLGWELGELQRAVDAARILLEEWDNDHLLDSHSQRESVPAAEAVLSLVRARLRDLCRALSGDLDPARLVASHNDKTPLGREGEDPDVYLRGWGLEQIRTELFRAAKKRARKPGRPKTRTGER